MADGRSGYAARLRGEESPDTIRQHAVENTREAEAKAAVDGKCHRKQTAVARKRVGKGEKAG